jgi:hypothetical protein
VMGAGLTGTTTAATSARGAAAGLATTGSVTTTTGSGQTTSIIEQDDSPYSTALGWAALAGWWGPVTGQYNTAVGNGALAQDWHGAGNAAVGAGALSLVQDGSYNVAMGKDAANWATGNYSVAVGAAALLQSRGSNSVAVGADALHSVYSGYGDVALGYQAGYWATGSYNVYIAHPGVANEDHAIYLGTAANHTKTVLVGNVGIGTSSPQTVLHLYNGSVATARMRFDSGSGIYSEMGTDSAASHFGAGIFYGGTQQAHFSGGGLSLGTYVNADPPANGLVVSGNVGIGTAAPQTVLHLYSVSVAQARMRMDSGAGIYTEVGTDAAAPHFGAVAGGWRCAVVVCRRCPIRGILFPPRNRLGAPSRAGLFHGLGGHPVTNSVISRWT